ncbi:MAG TPA: hypothetical protein VJV75_02925, partial [Candidatus Polarisedimenticolia bacterium]|nr:hypothetical protein [Candidatus Polarisedimenticolia bacterium]
MPASGTAPPPAEPGGTTRRVAVDPRLAIGGGAPLAFIAGPCVIESREHALFMARSLAAIAKRLGVPYVFKASYD